MTGAASTPATAAPDEPAYGWVVVGACFIALAVIFGVSYSFAAFFEPFAAEFGANRGHVSLVFGFCGLVYFGAGVFGGRIGISNAPARPDDKAATQQDRISTAARSWQRCPFRPPSHSPAAALAWICLFDLRGDPYSATPHPLGAQRCPAALRRRSLRMWC